MDFKKQTIREDIVVNILKNISLNNIKLYTKLISDNHSTDDDRRIGFLFETVSILLLISKCIKINYTNILTGQLQSLKKLTNINDILKQKIAQGNNPSDITIQHDETIIAFSVKYRNKFIPKDTDIASLDSELQKITKNYSLNGVCVPFRQQNYNLGLIIKDKTLIENHLYKNDASIQKELHDKIISDRLLLDEKDIIIGLKIFCNRFNNLSLEQFIETINKDYLKSPRKQLILKLHQQMTFLNFVTNIKSSKHLISHKPRSGKSITILNICKYMLENKIKKILIMTSVPATINSFINDLNTFIDFKNIKYVNQDEFKSIDKNFIGIVFCSVQYLKTNTEEKKQILNNIKFDTMIIDECHIGSSTEKTEKDILYTDNIEDIRNNIKINIFASGTSDKTKKFYKIKNVYEWEIEDEGYMKELNNDISLEEKEEILSIMKNRHGNEFIETLNDHTLNKDYSKYPTQVLMKHSIPNNLIDDIKEYNTKNNSNYGYSCNSLFALNKVKTKSNKYEYENKFELENSSDGIEILKSFFECIISDNKMNKKTIMKLIEETQSSRKSRISKKGDAKLFIMYLPIHTGNNNISQLQKTFTRFIKDNKLWTDYNIEYSNSIEDSSASKEEYNDYIETIINKSNKDNKKGCILLLGNKGGVGITYHNCDTTISLDDGHNLDNQKQRYSRALTEAENKTIGINVDMNIQRTYLYLNDIIHKHKRITKTTKTNGEIIKYLYDHNVFLFNPSEISNGKISSFDITSYYNKEAENILLNIDDTELLNNIIVCDDDIIGDDEVEIQFSWNDKTNQLDTKIINPELEGEQQYCPKGEETKKYIEDNNTNNSDDESKEHSEKSDDESEEITQVEEDKKEKHKQILKEVCKRVLFPLLSLLSRTYQQLEFKDMLFHSETKEIINSILKDKKILLNINSYNSIIRIINNNNEIINNIREIYRISPANKIHQLIAKHFIPSVEEKKDNAEIPTPIILVEEMLNKISIEFWKKPQKVFEPCCGKGNFVMKIFEKFYNGLEELYLDKYERCKIIINECLYYADLTHMNIFITTEILKCEILSKIDLDEINENEFIFNKYNGDTLEIDINKIFNIDNFDAVIGNPPYNSSGYTSTGNTIWQEFTRRALNKFLCENGLLLFVHPPGWRKPNTERGKFYGMFDDMTKTNQMIYLEIHSIKDGQKVFKCGTRYDWYLIEHKPKYKNTIVIDEFNNINEIDLSIFKWLPNSNIETIQNILAINNDETCPIIYNRSNYGSDNKKYISKIKDDIYKYPVIHTIPLSGIRYIYSSCNDKGHYGISKVIFGDNGLNDVIIDMNGDFAMSENSMAIKVSDLETAQNIKKALLSKKFKKFIKCCIIGNFRIDWRLFKEFKKNFWKDFLNDEIEEHINNELPEIIKDGRKQYYLIENKLYKVKKDKSQGELFGTYIDGKIEESIIEVKKKKIIKKSYNEYNHESVDKPIIEVKKKKSIVKNHQKKTMMN
jgi:hypothetical protein